MAFEITKQEIIKQAIALNKLWKQTREQKYRDEELRLRRIAVELENVTLGGGSQNLQEVTDLGNTTTNTIDTAGTKSDYFLLDTTATPTLQPGMFGWNDAYGTADLRLKGDNVTLQVGQEIIARVVNKTGADLLESEYKVVRVRIASEGGAQGQRLAVVLAQGDNDPDSVTTLGIVTETILDNQEGFITILGNVSNIDTTGTLQGETWVDGDVLYLSPTTPGALTKVPPVSPQHTVTMGYVVYAHQNQGKIFVKVDNGYELDELHNVLITSAANNDLLQYDLVQGVWKNVPPSLAVPTPTLDQVTTAGNTTTNAITVGGLTVSGMIQVFKSGTSAKIRSLDLNTDFLGKSDDTGGFNFYGGGDYNRGGGISVTGRLNGNPSSIFFFRDNFNQSARFFASGNLLLGSGTTDAGYKLDVNGTFRASGQIFASNGLYSTGSLITSQSGLNSGRMTMFNLRNTGGGYQSAVGTSLAISFTNREIVGVWTDDVIENIVHSNTAGAVTTGYNFYTHNNQLSNASPYLAMSINGGNVGIGTTAPTYKLQIEGNSNTTNGIRIKSLVNNNTLDLVALNNDAYILSTNRVFIKSSTTFAANNAGNIGIGVSNSTSAAKLHVIGNTLFGGAPNTLVNARLHVVGSGTTSATTAFRVENSNATPSLVVLDNGNVGIGTNTPEIKLHVLGNSNNFSALFDRGIKDGSVSGFTHFYGAGNAHILGRVLILESSFLLSPSAPDVTSSTYRFSNAANKLSLTELVAGNPVNSNIIVFDGPNVGIGTSSPSQALQVGTTSTNNTKIQIVSDGFSTVSGLELIRGGSTWNIINKGNFTIERSGSALLTVTATTNVLIGTTTDSGYKLDVNGTARVSGNLEVNAGSNGRLFINNVYPQILFGKTGTPSWSIFVDTENSGQFEIGTGAGFPYNTFSSKFYISTLGNVGIGTTTPAYKLDVNGTVSAQLTSATHTDQVYYDTATGELTYGPAASGTTPTLDQVTTAGNTTTNAITVSQLYITNGTNTGFIKNAGLNNYPIAMDLVMPTSGALRFGAVNFDGPAFQGFHGTAPSYTGQMYFDYGSQQRSVAGRGAFFRNASSPSPVTVMKLTESSNVLIGTTTDSGLAKLQVQGEVSADAYIAAGQAGLTIDIPTGAGQTLHFEGGILTSVI